MGQPGAGWGPGGAGVECSQNDHRTRYSGFWEPVGSCLGGSAGGGSSEQTSASLPALCEWVQIPASAGAGLADERPLHVTPADTDGPSQRTLRKSKCLCHTVRLHKLQCL